MNYLQFSDCNAHGCDCLAIRTCTLHSLPKGKVRYILTLVDMVTESRVIGNDAHNLTNLNGVVEYQVVSAVANFWVMFDVEKKKPSISRVRRVLSSLQDAIMSQRD